LVFYIIFLGVISMPFVNAGEASEAGRHAQAHMQTLMEMLFKLAEAAALRHKAEPEPEPETLDETSQDAEPSLSDSLESHVERDALHDSVSRLASGKGDGLVYQAEGFSVFRHTETMGTTYQVTTPDGEPLLTFEQAGSDLRLIEDHLSPELKQDLLAAGERLQTSDLVSVLHHPNPKVVMASMGEAAPAGTRAAWVTQQMLKGRDSFTPDHGNFQFDRDTRGNLSVTDRTNQQVLLSVTPGGQVTCTMNVEQLEQFKPAFDRLQSYEAQQAAAKGVGQATQSSKGSKTAQLALER
jgi:hypothetical protein